MKVQVLKERLAYGHRFYDVGSVIPEVPEAHAKVLSRIGRVRIVKDDDPKPPRRRRVYRRKDIQPQEQIVVAPEVAE